MNFYKTTETHRKTQSSSDLGFLYSWSR